MRVSDVDVTMGASLRSTTPVVTERDGKIGESVLSDEDNGDNNGVGANRNEEGEVEKEELDDKETFSVVGNNEYFCNVAAKIKQISALKK